MDEKATRLLFEKLKRRFLNFGKKSVIPNKDPSILLLSLLI
jgi:hypothetical protein